MPTTVRDELTALQQQNDLLRGEDIHKWAVEHPSSAIHAELEWDDAKAGYEHRLQQIRRLVAIHLVDAGGARQVISLSIDRVLPGGGYRRLDDVLPNASFRLIMLRDALTDLQRIQQKYSHLTELAQVWEEIDRVKAAAEAERPRRGRRRGPSQRPTA